MARSSRRSTARGSRRSRGGKAPLKKVGGKRRPARTSSAREDKRDEGQGLVRLNKFLADNGVASRRASDELIQSGKVLVDDQIVTELGTKIDPTTQMVDVNGVRLRTDPRERRYYLLHKPPGVVCTNEMRETRPRAIDLITDPGKGRIFSVGRLDEESKGLIIMTSDGEFAERIAHPRYGVEKCYLVKTPGKITDEAVQKIREGVHLAEGRTAGARVLVKRRTANGSTLEVSIQEGKNREVRRVFARMGYKVLALTRISIGPIGIRGLKEGRWRALSREEVEGLLEASDENREGGAEAADVVRQRRGSGARRASSGSRRGGGARGSRRPGGSSARGGSAGRRRGGRRRR